MQRWRPLWLDPCLFSRALRFVVEPLDLAIKVQILLDQRLQGAPFFYQVIKAQALLGDRFTPSAFPVRCCVYIVPFGVEPLASFIFLRRELRRVSAS